MQAVKEIWFVCYDEIPESDIDDTNGTHGVPKAGSRMAKAFDQIEKILVNLDVTPEIARIERYPCSLNVFSDYEFTFEHALYVMKKLEEVFNVTFFEVASERDGFDDSEAHVLYGFYSK